MPRRRSLRLQHATQEQRSTPFTMHGHSSSRPRASEIPASPASDDDTERRKVKGKAKVKPRVSLSESRQDQDGDSSDSSDSSTLSEFLRQYMS
ncbi:MAG TPA: hypothetical protein VGO47_02780 [Chlamydiales bacterium]|nr:hypothetical protein [Chlamydiales bacterium]